MERPALILDADDTLWESNIYYEQTSDTFALRMEAEGFDIAATKKTFNQVEHERIPQIGYGPLGYVGSMVIAYQRLCQQNGRQADPLVEAEVEAIARSILGYPINLFEGVAETLPLLRELCRLFLLTKGDRQTQQDKIERSGTAHYFEAIHIVPEKGPQVLQDLLTQHGLCPQHTWMVGNSPRSDINPALEVGIRAIFIPYEMTWEYEKTPFIDPDQVITMQRFSDLLGLFPAGGMGE
jgi:putative hydrolase of the HAD superfamily